eukprot:SAG31_NODE_466_length_15291_cov_7.540066_7_plen_170_part_00
MEASTSICGCAAMVMLALSPHLLTAVQAAALMPQPHISQLKTTVDEPPSSLRQLDVLLSLSDFVGANGAHGDQWYEPPRWMAAAGGGAVGTLRSNFDWMSAERVQGTWTWNTSDLQRAVAARAAGLRYLPMLVSTGGSWQGPLLGPPYNRSGWAHFVSEAVKRCQVLRT